MPTVLAEEVKINAADHVGLAHAVASQFVDPKKRVKDSDEYSEACVALVEAVADYTPEEGPFPTYAWRVMRNRIIDFIRRSKRRKRQAEFDHGCCLEFIEASVPDAPVPTELLPTLLEDYPGEDRTDKMLLIEVYLCGGKVPEIAARMGVSKMRIYQRINRALAKIRIRHHDLLEQYRGTIK